MILSNRMQKGHKFFYQLFLSDFHLFFHLFVSFVCIISFHKVEKQINNSKKFSHDEHLMNVLFVALHEKIHISNPVPFTKFIIIRFIKHHYNFIFIILVVVNAGQATRVIQAMILWMIVLLP